MEAIQMLLDSSFNQIVMYLMAVWLGVAIGAFYVGFCVWTGRERNE
jgi:hypothetical protein